MFLSTTPSKSNENSLIGWTFLHLPLIHSLWRHHASTDFLQSSVARHTFFYWVTLHVLYNIRQTQKAGTCCIQPTSKRAIVSFPIPILKLSPEIQGFFTPFPAPLAKHSKILPLKVVYFQCFKTRAHLFTAILNTCSMTHLPYLHQGLLGIH